MEHECVIDKFRSSEALCVHHLLKRINALTWRRGDDTCAGRGVPYSEANRDHSGGRGTQTDLAHPKSPSARPQHAVVVGSGMKRGQRTPGWVPVKKLN